MELDRLVEEGRLANAEKQKQDDTRMLNLRRMAFNELAKVIGVAAYDFEKNKLITKESQTYESSSQVVLEFEITYRERPFNITAYVDKEGKDWSWLFSAGGFTQPIYSKEEFSDALARYLDQ